MLDLAQKESLDKNLLARASRVAGQPKKKTKAEREARKQELWELVDDNAEEVVDGAKAKFAADLSEGFKEQLSAVFSRCVKRTPKSRGLPVFFKLRRQCYKRILELAGGDEDEDTDMESGEKLKIILEDFSSKWESLEPYGEVPTAAEEQKSLSEAIQSRHLQRHLEQEYRMPSGLSKKMKRSNSGSASDIFVKSESVQKVLKKLPDPVCQEKRDLFAAGLKEKRLVLGHAEGDGNCLFRSLDQFLSRGPDGTGGSGLADQDDDGHASLRQALVSIVLSSNQTEEAQRLFRAYHETHESVYEWAVRMRQPGVWGDEVM